MWKNIYIKSHQVWHFRYLIIHFECYFKHFEWQIYSHSSVCCMEFSLYLVISTLEFDYTYIYVLSRWLWFCDSTNIIKIFGYEQQNIVKHKYLRTKKRRIQKVVRCEFAFTFVLALNLLIAFEHSNGSNHLRCSNIHLSISQNRLSNKFQNIHNIPKMWYFEFQKFKTQGKLFEWQMPKYNSPPKRIFKWNKKCDAICLWRINWNYWF